MKQLHLLYWSFGLFVVCSLGVSSVFSTISDDNQTLTGNNLGESSPVQSRPKLPKIFDFDGFKRLFKRSYSSLLEEVARRKLYLASAFKVFTSSIKYRYRSSTFYLAINSLSDWTKQELKSISVDLRKMFGDVKGESEISKSFNGESNSHGQEVDEVADLEEIQSGLEQVAGKLEDDLKYKKLAAEFKRSSQSSRRKRSADEPESDNHNLLLLREFDLDDLIGSPEVLETSSKIRQKVASNNPDYMEPELRSFGTEADLEHVEGLRMPALSFNQVSLINRIPGANYVKSLVDSAISGLKSTGNGGHKMGSSWPFEESTLVSPTNVQSNAVSPFNLPSIPPPDGVDIDHRESDCFFQPRNQKACNSCYAFSTIALFEWSHCIATGDLVAFSEQYIVDCGHRFSPTMMGCDGADLEHTVEFVKGFGLELLSNYGYHHGQDQCPYDESIEPDKMGYLRIKQGGFIEVTLDQLDKTLRRAPLLIGLYLGPNFHVYGGGVDNVNECDFKFGHAMVLVGKGQEDGLDYYLIRNSYGVEYGDSGYYKMARDVFYKCAYPKAFYPKIRYQKTALLGPQRDYDAKPIKKRQLKYLKQHLDAEVEAREMEEARQRAESDRIGIENEQQLKQLQGERLRLEQSEAQSALESNQEIERLREEEGKRLDIEQRLQIEQQQLRLENEERVKWENEQRLRLENEERLRLEFKKREQLVGEARAKKGRPAKPAKKVRKNKTEILRDKMKAGRANKLAEFRRETRKQGLFNHRLNDSGQRIADDRSQEDASDQSNIDWMDIDSEENGEISV